MADQERRLSRAIVLVAVALTAGVGSAADPQESGPTSAASAPARGVRLFARANRLHDEGRTEDALRQVDAACRELAAVSAQDELVDALNLRAICLADLRRIPEAIAAHRETLVLLRRRFGDQPVERRARSLFSLASCHARLGEYRDALECEPRSERDPGAGARRRPAAGTVEVRDPEGLDLPATRRGQ